MRARLSSCSVLPSRDCNRAVFATAAGPISRGRCYDQGMQILVVEDERSMANLLKRTLQEEGHQVVVTGNGREGF